MRSATDDASVAESSTRPNALTSLFSSAASSAVVCKPMSFCVSASSLTIVSPLVLCWTRDSSSFGFSAVPEPPSFFSEQPTKTQAHAAAKRQATNPTPIFILLLILILSLPLVTPPRRAALRFFRPLSRPGFLFICVPSWFIRRRFENGSGQDWPLNRVFQRANRLLNLDLAIQLSRSRNSTSHFGIQDLARFSLARLYLFRDRLSAFGLKVSQVPRGGEISFADLENLVSAIDLREHFGL